LFEVSGDEKWLIISKKLTDYTFEHFYDEKSGLFYFSEKNNNSVLTNHFQKEDNVIPSANSVMANNLHRLFLLLGKPDYRNISDKMAQHILPQIEKYPMAYANWGNLILMKKEPFFEVAILGADAKELMKEMQNRFRPNVLWATANSESKIPILEGRFNSGENLIFVCKEGVCMLPVYNATDALKTLD
jgi:uncharacterized protein YyaL (SSP411 family)